MEAFTEIDMLSNHLKDNNFIVGYFDSFIDEQNNINIIMEYC